MIDKEKITKVLYASIDEINDSLPANEQLGKSLDVSLDTQSGSLDSLGIISLIIVIEQKIKEEFGVTVTLMDERAMSRKASPFKTVDTLVDYIYFLLKEKSNEN